MPARVAAQQSATNARNRVGSTNQSRASNNSRSDDWDSSGVEGPATRKRVQKRSSNSSMNNERKYTTTANTRNNNNVEVKSTIASRRRQSSIANQKGPMGPRPLDLPSGKRSVSNNVTTSGLTSTSTARSLPHEPRPSINSISRFSFASIAPTTENNSRDLFGSNDPTRESPDLQPINFDDFHESITNTEPSLNSFPLPGGGGRLPPGPVEDKPKTAESSFGNTTRNISGTSSVGRTGSLSRRLSNGSASLSRTASKSDAMQPAVGPGGVKFRSRRQSHFPPNSFNNPPGTRAPRKSIGPGTFAPETTENEPPKRRPSIGARSKSNDTQKEETPFPIRLNSQGTEGQVPRRLKISTNAHTMRAKSYRGPSQDSPGSAFSTSKTPDLPVLSPINSIRSPGRSTNSGNGTPASAKRMSTMPHHATGLGARTISPTDARRMKRMSMAQPTPPIPQNYLPQSPPTPHFDNSTIRPRSFQPSPAHNPRKSVTPSSSRTTPDPNRKSYSSGQSLSSSTSYGSVRNSALGPQARMSQSVSSSRLPTPKPRSEGGDANGDEDVPPVPAIPKAFESPQSEMEQPFFSARSSSLPHVDSPFAASPLAESYPGNLNGMQTPQDSQGSSRKSSLNPETEPQSRAKQNTTIASKKNIQPVRLPPLNLFPLSTPTAAKIKALEAPVLEEDDRGRPLTPPKRFIAKTPSTPMTASKSSFFSKSQRDGDTVPISTLRSSSSHFALRPDPTSYRPPSSSSSNIPLSFDGHSPGLRTISPFISSSVPKNSGDFASYMRPKFNSNTSSRVNGPRAPNNTNTIKEDNVSPSDTDNGSTLAGLRRKLSLNRKKSVSKAKETAMKEDVMSDANLTDYETMPPPKLPASATWGNMAPQSSVSPSRPTYLRSRRKTSASSISSNVTKEYHQSIGSEQSSRTDARPSMDSMRSFEFHPNRSSSLLPPAQMTIKTKAAPPVAPKQPELDKDDLAAEEEMKKLGSRRKDFETAAKELDSLQKRAAPRDCVAPSQALMMANLNIFERGEIVDYREVYFTGTRTAQKVVGDLNAASANFGYDDERGDYNIIEGDHLAYRYEVVDLLGKGSFGQVVRCIDHKTGILVAVKIIRNKKRFHQQALVEVNILQKLKEWDRNRQHSVVNFDQEFYFRGHLCISTDLLGMNLYEFIKAHDFRGFSLKLIRRFTKQLLGTLRLLNGHKVIHCDLKPENVLLAHPMHSEIKVIDFGSSCFENEKVYTYIQSRFYRSPEVILGMSYGMPIDMWSLGCILAELYTGYPIFPGENEQEQLACIMEVFGPPERHLIEKSSRKKLFFDSMGKPRLTISSKGRRRRPSSKDLRSALKCDDEAFLDFIARCLRWDPAKRLNPHEATVHEFITGVKASSTRRPLTMAASSPVKRIGSMNAPAGSRPLPQPPATSFKNSPAVRNVDNASNSPLKASVPKRHSTVNGLQPSFTAKRASNIAVPNNSTSSLPRATPGQRSASGRPDLATAAAATSLKSR